MPVRLPKRGVHVLREEREKSPGRRDEELDGPGDDGEVVDADGVEGLEPPEQRALEQETKRLGEEREVGLVRKQEREVGHREVKAN